VVVTFRMMILITVLASTCWATGCATRWTQAQAQASGSRHGLLEIETSTSASVAGRDAARRRGRQPVVDEGEVLASSGVGLRQELTMLD